MPRNLSEKLVNVIKAPKKILDSRNYRAKTRNDKINRLNDLKNINNRHNTTRGDIATPDNLQTRNYDTYKYDHFCGADSKIFFGDIWVDDIVTIQYSISQSKQPIYGYAKQEFESIAMGRVLGEGSFTISFKEVGYLNLIHNVLREQRVGVQRAVKRINSRLGDVALVDGKETSKSDRLVTYGVTSGFSPTINDNVNPGLVRQSQNIEQILDTLATKQAGVTNEVDGTRLDFDELSQIYEDAIWGNKYDKQIGGEIPELLRADEFDNEYNYNGDKLKIKVPKGSNYGDSLNIIITFGNIDDRNAEQTLYSLNDVHFTGQSMIVTPEGDPIGETYTFIFRDINKSVNTERMNLNPLKLKIDGNEHTISKWEDINIIADELDTNPTFGQVTLNIISGYDSNNRYWTGVDRNINYDFTATGTQLRNELFKSIEDKILEKVEPTLYSKLLVKVNYQKAQYKIILESNQVAWDITSPSKRDTLSLDLVRREDFFYQAGDEENIGMPRDYSLDRNAYRLAQAANAAAVNRLLTADMDEQRKLLNQQSNEATFVNDPTYKGRFNRQKHSATQLSQKKELSLEQQRRLIDPQRGFGGIKGLLDAKLYPVDFLYRSPTRGIDRSVLQWDNAQFNAFKDVERYGSKIKLIQDKYGKSIKRAARTYGVDEDILIATIIQESGGKVGAVSSVGAAGLTQITRPTARQFGLDYDKLTTSADYAIQGGAKIYAAYERQVLTVKEYQNYTTKQKAALVWSAYNAGPDLARKYGVPLIPQTQQYVYNLLNLYDFIKRQRQKKIIPKRLY